MEHFYRVREEIYSNKTSRFYPESKCGKKDTWHIPTYYGLFLNGILRSVLEPQLRYIKPYKSVSL